MSENKSSGQTEYMFVKRPTPQIEGAHVVDDQIAEDTDIAFAEATSKGKILIDRTKLQQKPTIKIPYDDPKLREAVKEFNNRLEDTAIVHAPPLKKE